MFPDISVRDTISFNWRLKKKGKKIGRFLSKGLPLWGKLSMQSVKGPKRDNRRIVWLRRKLSGLVIYFCRAFTAVKRDAAF